MFFLHAIKHITGETAYSTAMKGINLDFTRQEIGELMN
jgi:hypothetical protein